MFSEELPDANILSARISVIVFSKDRPLQLQAYLESLLYYSGIQENSIYVLHKATDISYQDLINKYSRVNWIAEKDFYSDLIATINQVGDFILWGCDDVLFKSFFNPEICAKSLDEDSEIFGFSLRNGKNIQPCPHLSDRGEYWLCNWTDAPQGYWSYPWEVSASVYRKKDVLDFVKLSNNIINPNYFEGELAHYFSIHKGDCKKYIACFEVSKTVTLTINRVQETHPNLFDGTKDTDINSLYQYFIQGYKLNWRKLKDCNNSLAHVMSEYFELEPPVTTEPIVDDINDPDKSISITDYLAQGDELLESGQRKEAIASLQKAVESNRSSPWPYYHLGLALDKDGQLEGAVSEFGRAIALYPDLIWAHHYLGETLVKLGRLEEAVGEFQRAIELKPDLSWSYYHFGEALCQLGRWDEAVVNLRRAIELNPDFCWCHHYLGEALSRLQKWNEAAVALNQALTLHEHFGSYSALGQCWEKLGELEKAIAAYRQAIKLNPDVEEIHLSLAEMLQQQAKLDLEQAALAYRRAIDLNPEKIESYQKLLEIQPENSDYWFSLGKVLEKKGDVDSAVKAYRRACELKPEDAGNHQQLGELLVKLDRLEEAIASLSRAVELAPDSGHDAYLLGVALTRMGNEEDAIATFRRAGELLEQQGKLELAITAYQKALESSSNADISFKLGMLHAQCGQYSEALTQYQQTLQSQPEKQEVYANLAVILVQQGLGEQVINCYHQVFQNKPETAKNYYNLGIILSQQGLTDAAVAFFRQAPQKHPSEAEVYDRIWRGLNQLGPLTEENHYYPTEIKPELAEAHFNQTSQYKVFLFNNLTDNDKDWLEKAGLSLVNLETMSKDDISLEELYINSFADGQKIQLSRKYLTRTLNAYQSMAQTGYIYTLCPITGKIVRSNQSFHIHYGDFNNFIYRFVSQEVFYLITGHWMGIKLCLYFPRKNLVIWFHKDVWVGEHIIDKLKASLVSQWFKVKSYISTPEPKPTAVVYGHISNISHYMWNEVTGMQYLAVNGCLTKIDKFLTLPYDYYNIPALFEEVSEDKVVVIPHANSLLETILENNLFAMRVTDTFITEALAKKIVNYSLAKCANDGVFLQEVEQAKKCFPLIWITIRSHRRVWISQIEGFANIINKLCQDYPKIGIVFDGWGCMDHRQPDPRDQSMIQQENEIRLKIIDLIAPEIATYSAIGATNFEKALWANAVDMYIQPEGTGLTHVTWIANRPGVIFSHKQAMGQKWYWFNNRENAIEPALIKDEYLIGNAKDIGLGHHSNFDCDWSGIYIEAVEIMGKLTKRG